jgi:soluble lytic murein transglycosylase-like protein
VAAAHYCAAARDGSVEGQYRLGRLYLMGQGVARDNQVPPRCCPSPPSAATRRPAAWWASCRAASACPIASSMRPLIAADSNEAVPHEVVERFVKALPADKRRHAQLVQKLAPRFQIDPRLALAIVRTESNFDAAARSPKNALGLMQLIPDTAERFGVRDALDPEQNIRGGLAYLRGCSASSRATWRWPLPPTTPAKATWPATRAFRPSPKPRNTFAASWPSTARPATRSAEG